MAKSARPKFLKDPFYLDLVKRKGDKFGIALWIVMNWRRTKRNATGFTIERDANDEPTIVVYLAPGKRLTHQPAKLEGVRIVYR